MEFNKEGRIILPAEPEERKNSIILTRIQVNERNPAIAQLKITLGQNLSADKEVLIKEIYTSCENFVQDRFSSVESEVKPADNEKVVVEARKSQLMYSLFEDLIKDIEFKYGYQKKYKIFKEGSYTNWDSK